MTRYFSLLTTTALSAVVMMGAATDAKAVPIQSDSSFSVNGVFSYEPELELGEELNLDPTLTALTEGVGTFTQLVPGSGTTPIGSLVYSTGSENVGMSFTLGYDDGAGNDGVFRFTVGETVASPIFEVNDVKAFRISGDVTIEDLTGYYDTTVASALFNGTFADDSGEGTYSATFVASPAPIPVPAALPLLVGGIGALGLVRSRRRRAAAA